MKGFNADDHRLFRGHRLPRLRIVTVLIFSMTLVLAGCNEDKQHRPAIAVPVTTAAATDKAVPLEVSNIGTVEAYSVVNITAMISGQIMRIHVNEGQMVQEGQPLLTIDDRPYKTALDSARSALSRDRIQLVKALRDAKRYADLFTKDYVTKDQAEQAQTNAEALAATIQGDEAAVKNAQLNVAYCRITAPITGRTGSILVNEGNIVKANETTTPLMVINQIQPVYVQFALPEQYLPEIRKNMSNHKPKVLVFPPGKPADTREGLLTFVNNTIDHSTGTIGLKATFANQDSGLWPGQFVNVVLQLGTRPHAVVVPSAAVQMGQEGDYVFVVDKDLTVKSRNVTPGPQIDDQIVIDKGLVAGETVVTDGQLRLYPGAKVVVKNDGHPAGATRQ